MVDAGKSSLIWSLQARIRPQSRVTTPLWAPSADSGQRTKPRKRGAKFGPKNDCSARPWCRRAMIPGNERCLYVDCSGHSASVLRDSAQKTQKNGLFMGFPGTFTRSKSRIKVDAGKPSSIWTQWTWKPSPRSIGFDADENGQSRQAQHHIPIGPVEASYPQPV
jgi:hypothetical protein